MEPQGQEQGLAGMGVGPDQGQEMVQEVMQMLMQGVSPEELLQMGVPQEVLEMAMQMLNEQQAQQQGMDQGVPAQPGLAGGGMMA